MGAITAIASVVIGFLLGSMVALPNGFLFIHTHYPGFQLYDIIKHIFNFKETGRDFSTFGGSGKLSEL